MLTLRKISWMAVSLLLITVLPVASPAQEPRPPDERQRELRESRERRAREILEAQERLLDEARGLRTEADGPPRIEPWELLRDFMPHEREGLTRKEGAARAFFEAMLRSPSVHGPEESLAQIEHLRDGIRTLAQEERELHRMGEELERAGRLEDLERIRDQLERVRHEIGEHEAQIARLTNRQQREGALQHLQAMIHRLEYVSNWQENAFDARRSVMMATQAIVELGMARGAPEDTAGVLRQLLEQVEELGSRTAIRFALKDIYMEMDSPRQAHDQMVQVILENARGITPRAQHTTGRELERQGRKAP